MSVISAAMVGFACSELVTRTDMTRTAIVKVCFLLNDYAKDHGSLPVSLDALPKPKPDREINYLVDGWGRPLVYQIGKDSTVTVCGRVGNGLFGGGDDANTCLRYYSKRTDGTLWAGSDDWLLAAQVPGSEGKVGMQWYINRTK
jgi:hypothetical protein